MADSARWDISPAASLEGMAEEWDALVTRVAEGHPLLKAAFLAPLVRHYGSKNTLLASVRDHSDRMLHAGALLERGSFGRFATFCPAQLQLCPLVADVGQPASRLLATGKFSAISLLRFDDRYQSGRDSGAAYSHSSDYGVTMSIECRGSTFDSYWASRSKSLRKNVKRYYSRANDDYKSIRLALIAAHSDIEEAVLRYAAIESKGWKGKMGTGIEAGSVQARFYTECLQRFALVGGARVYELHFDDHLVASRLCVVANGILVILKTTYDEAFAKCAPGRMLLHELIQNVFADSGIRTIEFYTKANADQLMWASESRSISDITLYRNRLLSSLASTKRTVATAIGKLTKRARN
jgi:hypothetical protein